MHSLELKIEAPVMLGTMVFCSKCGCRNPISYVFHAWGLRCKNCSWGRTYESSGLARAGARKHMLQKRHHVMIWDLDRAEGTLEVLQPATDEQMYLGEEAPF